MLNTLKNIVSAKQNDYVNRMMDRCRGFYCQWSFDIAIGQDGQQPGRGGISSSTGCFSGEYDRLFKTSSGAVGGPPLSVASL